MKILIFCAGFFPAQKYGGPPVSINNFSNLLYEDQCFIVTHNHEKGEKKILDGITSGWNSYGNAKVLYLSDSEFNRNVFKNIIRKVDPDITYFQSLFESFVLPGLYAAMAAEKEVLLAPRGELCAGAMRKKYKKIPYILFLRLTGLVKTINFQSTSNEETEAIKRYFHAPGDKIHYLTNIPSIPNTEVSHPIKSIGESKILFISRIVPKKNLTFALKCLCKISGKVAFDIYGSIEDEDYWNTCRSYMEQLPDNITVNYCGSISHEQVNELFSQYDAFLFPTYSENYGHVIVEAMLAKCIPIISDQTPWNDLEFAGAGWVISLDREQKFIDAINTVVSMDENQISEVRQQIAKYTNEKLKVNEVRMEYKKAFSRIAKH